MQTDGLTMPTGDVMKELSLEDSYKYLSILQADDIKHAQVKKKVCSRIPEESAQSPQVETEWRKYDQGH